MSNYVKIKLFKDLKHYMYIMSSTETPNVSTNTGPDGNDPSTNGRVKWFNNKAGYGFITVSSDEHNGEDVFVHHSAIDVAHEQYRYLVQGEYVEFVLCTVNDDNHKWQAGSVKGINNGKLMCETRLESRESRVPHKAQGDEEVRHNSRSTPRDDLSNHYRIRTRGPGPREGDEWMLVRRRAPRSQPSQSSSQEVLRPRQARGPYRDGEN